MPPSGKPAARRAIRIRKLQLLFGSALVGILHPPAARDAFGKIAALVFRCSRRTASSRIARFPRWEGLCEPFSTRFRKLSRHRRSPENGACLCRRADQHKHEDSCNISAHHSVIAARSTYREVDSIRTAGRDHLTWSKLGGNMRFRFVDESQIDKFPAAPNRRKTSSAGQIHRQVKTSSVGIVRPIFFCVTCSNKFNAPVVKPRLTPQLSNGRRAGKFSVIAATDPPAWVDSNASRRMAVWSMSSAAVLRSSAFSKRRTAASAGLDILRFLAVLRTCDITPSQPKPRT